MANDGGGFCQWVADNFDFNEDSLTGQDTTTRGNDNMSNWPVINING